MRFNGAAARKAKEHIETSYPNRQSQHRIRMTPTDLASQLELPPNTNSRNLVARALRQHCAGGAELLAAKEWAAGVANTARNALADPRRAAYSAENRARREIAELALAKVLTIEAALIAALERVKSLPPGSLAKYQKGDRPS